jgi:D-3-phosphoglycerate dehydrogenase
MADYKVVISDYIFPQLDIEKQMLPAAGAEVVIGQCRTAAELIELAHDADGMLNTYFEPVDTTNDLC